MDKILLILMLAVTVEALVEYGKSIAAGFTKNEWKTAATQIVAIAISIAVCLSTSADLYAASGIDFRWPPVGMILTGIFASRGANFVSDFITKLQGAKSNG